MADAPVFSTQQPGGILSLINRQFHPGKVFFVDSGASNTGDTAGKGRSPDSPVSTLDYAMSLCEADRGDTIYVMPGHTETVGTVACDISDVTIIGLGNRKNRPTLTFDTTTDEFLVSADDVTVKGLRLVSGVNNLANFFDVAAHGLTIDNCDMITSSTKEAYCFVNLNTTYDDLTIRNCFAWQPSDPEGTNDGAGTGFLYCVDSENIILEDNIIIGNFETSIIHNKTTKAQNLWSRRNTYRQELATGFIFELVAATTGHSRFDSGHSPNADDATPAKMIGSYDIEFWFGTDSQFSNDSGGGGQGMIASEAACS